MADIGIAQAPPQTRRFRLDLPAARTVAMAVLGVLFAGVAGRLLSYPLNKDEHLFVSASAMFGQGDLYRDLGYSHLPNLPLLLGGIYAVTGTEHYLLVGRLMVVAFWALAIFALWLISQRLKVGWKGFAVASALLLGNVLLLREPGMLTSNNFLPIPLFLVALYFMLGAMDAKAPSPRAAFLAGLFVSITIGFKANYVFLAPVFAAACLLAPAGRYLRERVMKAFVPLAAGGVVGGLPTLYYLASDPDLFFVHTYRYFTEFHVAYWAGSTEPQIASPAQKVLLAESIWFANGTLLALLAILALALTTGMETGARGFLERIGHWTLPFMAVLALCGFAVSFVPSPSFDHYFVPPVPFLIAGFLLVLARLRPEEQARAVPLLAATFLVVLLTCASRIAMDLPRIAQPGSWTGVKIHQQARDLARRGGLAEGDSAATLSPILALEAGLVPLTEFAAGPFVYRVAQFIPAEDAEYFVTTSSEELEGFLDREQPAGIVLGSASRHEADLEAYALSHSYREIGAGEGRRAGDMRLLVRDR